MADVIARLTAGSRPSDTRSMRLRAGLLMVGGLVLAVILLFAWRFEEENPRTTPSSPVTR
jgi:hypothetical protein